MDRHIAFFDLDHTILDINSGVIMVKEAFRKNLIQRSDFVTGLIYSFLYKAGILKAEVIMERMAAWLKGTPEGTFIEFADQTFQKYIRPSIRDQARSMIEKHKNEGGTVVLLSASTPYVCNPIKEVLNFDDIICSRMEVINGRFSGNPEGKYCYGLEKLIRTRQYCHEQGFELEQAYYYADSISDLDVLDAIGYPRCVTPDKKLTKIAQKNDWTILHW